MLAKSEQRHRFESHLASELGWSASGQSGHQLHGMQPLVVIRGGLIIRRGGGRGRGGGGGGGGGAGPVTSAIAGQHCGEAAAAADGASIVAAGYDGGAGVDGGAAAVFGGRG